MKKLFITTAIIAFFAASCVKDEFYEKITKNVQIEITGTSMHFHSDNLSRAETINNLVENDSIIFSSKGGITADRDTLIYKNNKWNGLKQDKWDTNRENADYCAIHPVLKEYNENYLYYKNKELKDIIYCKATAEHNKEIKLSFNHLFAKLQINIDNELNNTVEKINITIPHSIENIDIKTGNTIINDNIKDVVLERNESARYELFIPTHENQEIAFEIITNKEKTYSSTIPGKNYMGGYEYICNVKYNNGIYTKDDFIAFSHLINNIEYKGRKLDEFFILKDGKRVFNLFSDLQFTEVETAQIKPIGDKNLELKEFDDIFNGNNHTISGIEYYSDTQKRSYVGLFGITSKNAIIKNVIMDNCSFTESKNKSFSDVGLLVVKNNGTIDNCVVRNSKLSTISNKRISGMCSTNNGYIINSSIENISIPQNNSQAGGLCHTNNGWVLNCNVHSKITTNKDEKVGAISYTNYRMIENVYTYGYTRYNYMIFRISSGSFSKIFLNKKFEDNKKIFRTNENTSAPKYITHNDSPEDYIINVEQLNNWIDTEGKSKYPDIKFRRWTYDGSSAPKLE